MVKIEMTNEMLDRNINSLEAAISLVQQKIETTHSGIDKFMLESFIIETREVIAELETYKSKSELTEAFVSWQPEG